MRRPRPLLYHTFGPSDPLGELSPRLSQARYLRAHLASLGASSVLEEPYYFDRDYLSEFAAFYSLSARGYQNICRRLHFFDVDRKDLRRLLRGATASVRTHKKLQNAYLGFCVLRPLPACPLGRTVLRWSPESSTVGSVIVSERRYSSHLAGVELTVSGLAWQQQDTGVGACATVALWSALHASAHDDFHGIPTTASITQSAHRTASLGARVFPSGGLTIEQIMEAIKEHDLSPLVLGADAESETPFGSFRGFTRARFASTVGALLRSSQPMVVVGELVSLGPHAICAMGFLHPHGSPPALGDVSFQDATISHLYVHDDNVGPGVTFRVTSLDESDPESVTVLVPDEDSQRLQAIKQTSSGTNYPPFVPWAIVAAVHEELRSTTDELQIAAMQVAAPLAAILGLDLSIGVRFVRLSRYLEGELRAVCLRPRELRRARLALTQRVPPMSLYLGVVRIGIGNIPVADVLFDTTDSTHHIRAFAHVVLHPKLVNPLSLMPKLGCDIGTRVDAF